MADSWILAGIGQLLTMEHGPPVGSPAERVGLVESAAVWVESEHIRWCGPERELPLEARALPRVDVEGAVVLPGLVDCHTHLIYAGDRAAEWGERLSGVSYEDIARRGGGIMSTVRATRAATDEELLRETAARLAALLQRGVTTVEIKTGYGLTGGQELRLLRLAAQVQQEARASVVLTWLGAHALPQERRDDRAGYLDEIIDTLPEVARWARFCDVYIDEAGFTLEEGERVLRAALAAGLKLKVHAEQRVYTGAARLAGELGACSAEHLEQIDQAGIDAMARGRTVAVLLPAAALFLRDTPPSAAPLFEAGVRVAVATDHNPGTSPTLDLLLAATLACLHQGLSVEQALAGITREAAAALDLSDRGRIAPGLRADLAVFRVSGYQQLVYRFGHSPCSGVVLGGSWHPLRPAGLRSVAE